MTDQKEAGSAHRTVWRYVLTWLVGFFSAGLVVAVSGVQGQRGAEPGAVVLENDKVIVRRYLLQPGMATGMHSHSRDYVRVILQGGTVEITALNGPSRAEQVEAGSVAWRSKNTHDSKNIGGGPIEGLVIEIK
jgi:hypothetical protein